MNGADIVVMLLALAGGGAIGAALGGGLSGALAWTGSRLHAAIGLGAVLGAAVGIVVGSGASMPNLASLAPMVQRASDEAEIERVLKAHYPSDYQAIEAKARTLQTLGASRAEIETAVRSMAMPLVQRQFALASTDNADAYYDIVVDEQKAMAQRPELCLRSMSQPSAATTGEIEAAMPDELKAREMRLVAQLLEQTATHPQPPHPPVDIDQKLTIWSRDAYDGLSFEERDALKGAGGPDAQGAAACKVTGNLLGMMAFFSPEDKAETFKALEAKGLQQMNG